MDLWFDLAVKFFRHKTKYFITYLKHGKPHFRKLYRKHYLSFELDLKKE